ncbi:MAG: hypothetical protein ACK5HT_12540 [Draconibacterium sp.]
MVGLVSYIMIVLFTQNVSVNNASSSIDEYIELSVELSRDTICIDSSFTLTVIFKNKTDSCLSFYPKAILSVVRPSGGFEYDSYFLNKVLDLRQEHEIAPYAIHKETFNVYAKLPTFRKGENRLCLHYLCKKQKGKFKKYNKLYGSLVSKEFKVFIK